MQDKYKEVIDMLSAKKPVLSQKEALVNRVMQNIDQTVKKRTIGKVAEYYLFGWADVRWLRKLMAAAAILFLGFFVFQQVTLTERITRLEKRLIENTPVQSGFMSQSDLKQRVFLGWLTRNEKNQDSVTISTNDLNQFLQSYSDLQERYEKIKHNIKEDSYIDRVLRKKFDNQEETERAPSNL